MRVKKWFIAIAALALLAGGCERKPGKQADRDLWWAVYQGDLQEVRSLLARGASVHARNSRGQTPLHNAAEGGHLGIAAFLVHFGADIDCPDDYGRTPVMLALDKDHKAVVEYLVREGAAMNLRLAAYLGDVPKVKELVDSGVADPKGREGDAAMYYAVSQGQRDVVKVLIAAGASLGGGGTDKRTPLHYAVRSNQLETARLPPDSGADPNAGPRGAMTPLYSAARQGNLDMVKLLLARGADANPPLLEGNLRSLPVEAAVNGGHTKVAELLIAAGADVNAADNEGWTLLHAAVESQTGVGVSADLPMARPGPESPQEEWDRYTDLWNETLEATIVRLLMPKNSELER